MKRITIVISYDEIDKLGLDYLGKTGKEIIILDGLKISREECVNIWKTDDPEIINKKRLAIKEFSNIGGSIYLVNKKPTDLTILLEKYYLYYEFPISINRSFIEINIRGFSKDLNLLFKELDKRGVKYRISKVTKYITPKDLLSEVTKKQKNALKTALNLGYFKTPRSQNAHQIAEKLGIRHTTLLQHLRRAQEKIFSRIDFND